MERIDKPFRQLTDPAEVLLGFLDFHRSAVADKVADMSEVELRASRVPTGWTPLEVVKHLIYMERRWFVWGFAGEQVEAPRGDAGPDKRWRVGPDETVEGLIEQLRAGGERTRTIVAAADLGALSALGGRFAADDARPRPTLIWILTYVLQEYARHAGHLDIVRELSDGATGE